MKRVYGNGSIVKSQMGDEEEDSAVKSRERRRQRMALRRITAGRFASSVVAGGEESRKLAPKTFCDNPSSSTTGAAVTSSISINESPPPPPPPVYGTMSVIGRQREMEDEVSVRTNLCRPEINGFRPVHFFGVFDGHGGSHVSALCKEKMHVIMEQELMRLKVVGDESNGGGGELWRAAINRSFQRMDEMALRLCLCGKSSDVCGCSPKFSFMGSTAVVSILTNEHVFVANCGDSRAILCRNSNPVPLSVDHKPDREDERARIESCGGRVMFDDGARVDGILAMSRAIDCRFVL